MTQAIARHIEPSLLARRNTSVTGLLGPERCARVEGLNGPVRVALDFASDAEGRATASGELEAEVSVRCERCLAPMAVRLHPRVQWRFIEAGAPPSEDADVDEIEFTGGEVDLAALIEDELLLVMPPYPRHAHACTGEQAGAALGVEQSGPEEMPAPRTQRPFAGLAGLLGRKPGPDGSQEEN